MQQLKGETAIVQGGVTTLHLRPGGDAKLMPIRVSEATGTARRGPRAGRAEHGQR